MKELLEESLVKGRAAARNGNVARYIPELGKADPNLVAIAVQCVDGETASAGDVAVPFTMQSVSKVFTLAHVLDAGVPIFDWVDTEPSGDAFHSIVRLEEEHGRPRNPLVNAGAIVVSDRLPGTHATERISKLQDYLRKASGGADTAFAVDESVYVSESETGFRNRALANYMRHFGVVQNPETAVDTYFAQCSITVTVRELARAALFFANDGRDPVRNEQLLSAAHNRTTLALMTTCGLYDEVGAFAVRVGLPAKSGVSGAILAIVPGRMSIACYGPALGPKGNSLAGTIMLEHLSKGLGLSVFAPP